MKTYCYCAAIRAVSRKTTALYDDELAPSGITLAQFSLMRRIRRAGAQSLTELARLAELDRSTVGRNIRVLEKMNIARLAEGVDQREASVSLTAKGAATLEEAEPRWLTAQAKVEAALGSDEAKRLLELAATF